ncbi:hypothetical protein [Legionella sp. km772]|uniref:hypothetical protein n=1 Tax=Legionella sp. km772 TaxID=2498111 RepID=UPI0018F6D8F7|nr:hypothetical protein [Legionella sp. km772]
MIKPMVRDVFERKNLALVQTMLILLGAPFFLIIDSPWLSPYFSHGQELANLTMVFFYVWFLLLAPRKLYWLLLLMTICSFFAEIIGSQILGLYQYRLKNIPMYIPLGHALIYATMYYLGKAPWIWQNHKAIERCLAKFAFVTAFMSLFILNDVAGFLCYLLFLCILHYHKKPLFYLFMFAMVYYIELLGTVFSTWSWYCVIGNHPHFPPIAYTPSGMAGIYILIDLISNSVYFYALKIIRYFRRLGLTSSIDFYLDKTLNDNFMEGRILVKKTEVAG